LPKVVGYRGSRDGLSKIERKPALKLRCNRMRHGWSGNVEDVNLAGREILGALAEDVKALELEIEGLPEEVRGHVDPLHSTVKPRIRRAAGVRIGGRSPESAAKPCEVV